MFNTKEANAWMKLISQLLYSIELLLYLSWGLGGCTQSSAQPMSVVTLPGTGRQAA